jgi:hypothetical protein
MLIIIATISIVKTTTLFVIFVADDNDVSSLDFCDTDAIVLQDARVRKRLAD